MKIAKAKLKQIIKEELEVILTNEEAGELFGEDLEDLLEQGFGEGTPPEGEFYKKQVIVMEDERGKQAGEERNNAVMRLGSVVDVQQVIKIISNLSDDALWGQQTMKDVEGGEDPSGWGDPWGSVLAFAGLPANLSSAVYEAISFERQARLDSVLPKTTSSDLPGLPSVTPPAPVKVPKPASPDILSGDLARGAYTLQDYEREMDLVKESFRKFLK